MSSGRSEHSRPVCCGRVLSNTLVVTMIFRCGSALWRLIGMLSDNHQIAKSQRRSKLPHNFYGQQEQSFLRHPIQESGLWCCRNSMHSEIDHSLPFRQLAPPFIPSTSTSKLVERDFQEGPNPHPLLSPSSPRPPLPHLVPLIAPSGRQPPYCPIGD